MSEPRKTTDQLKRAIELRFNMDLWPKEFVSGAALISAKRRLNIDSVVLGLILGTSAFLGKSQIALEGSDKVEVGGLWVCNIQVNFE